MNSPSFLKRVVGLLEKPPKNSSAVDVFDLSVFLAVIKTVYSKHNR